MSYGSIPKDGLYPGSPAQLWVCWCGHTREQHGPKTVDGSYRETACLLCDGLTCDEWQEEFCELVEDKTNG